MMKIAYFDACSGASGDMTVGALLDAGRDGGLLTIEGLVDALATLDVAGYRLSAEPAKVGALVATQFGVHIDHAPHLHRDWKTIRNLIESAGSRGLPEGTVRRAVEIFSVLADAEARVHGTTSDKVHFHEVGAIDSIVDIVGAAYCLDTLGIDACFVGAIPTGSGFVDTQHGRLPVPAPATALLLEGFDVMVGDGVGELVTPTGAAILQAMAKPIRPTMRLTSIGIGSGTRRLEDRPNVLRVMLGECDGTDDERVVELAADIDDMTPVALAHAADRIRALGAREVNVTASSMKKGRTGLRLTVLCDLENMKAIGDAVLNESTSIGLRYRLLNRMILERRIEVLTTEYGDIAVKVVARPDGSETAEPEFDDVSRVALAKKVAFSVIRDAALAAWNSR